MFPLLFSGTDCRELVSFLYIFGRFTSEPIWARYFIFEKLLISDSIFLINLGLLRLSISPCVTFGGLHLSEKVNFF